MLDLATSPATVTQPQFTLLNVCNGRCALFSYICHGSLPFQRCQSTAIETASSKVKTAKEKL